MRMGNSELLVFPLPQRKHWAGSSVSTIAEKGDTVCYLKPDFVVVSTAHACLKTKIKALKLPN